MYFDALAVAKLSIDCVLRILVPKRHRVGIDGDGYINKRMEYGTSSTDVTSQLPWVSIQANQ